MIRRIATASAIALIAGMPVLAAADVSSRFDAGIEGWSVVSFGDLSANNYSIVGTYVPTYNATGGNPGGYISSTDPDGGDFTFSASTAYLGQVASATGLSYDIAYFAGVNYQTTDVMLTGANGVRLLWERDPNVVPGTDWQTVTATFQPSSMWHVGTTNGSLATAADFQGVLADLSGLYIRGEYAFGSDSTGIDNVNLIGVSAVPEPGTVALFVAGLAAFAAGRYGRRGVAA